jgi:microcin C transport system permease protein
MLLNFAIVQAVPGGPIERILAELDHTAVSATDRISGGGAEFARAAAPSGGGQPTYRGAQGLPPEYIEQLERQFGFDKPLHERFLAMMLDFAVFDFGKSYYRDRSVAQLVVDKMPVSISLGLWTTLFVYLISIPLGISKAIRDGSRFDIATSTVVVIGNAVPSFLFAILLIVVFAGGQYLDWFPLRGLHSDGWRELSWFDQVKDYFWHIALPVFALVIGGFASLTILTKNSFLDEIGKQYVVTARAKGLNEDRVLYGHVFRNAMLIVIAGFPSAFIRVLFTGALLIEVIFSLDGLGLLGFEAAINRDYPVMFATLYFFTLLGLLMGLIADLTYAFVDPRIDFEARES